MLRGPRQIAIEQQARKPLAQGEVLLEILNAGICGTDLSLYRSEYPVPLPLVPGHEFIARVVDRAEDVDGGWLGKRVVCEINNSCVAYRKKELCAACRRGMPTHCLRRTVTGIINHAGAFAQYLSAPAGNLHVLPDEISSQVGVFIEPLAAAIRTFEVTPLEAGAVVVVLGCGRLGRLIALVANQLGARVIAVARTQRSLELVRGEAWKLVQASAEIDLQQVVQDCTDGLGADVVVEATGVNENVGLALQLVRPLGTVSLKSTSGVPVQQLRTTETIVNEVQIATSRCGPFDKAIQFMLEHKLPNAGWITSNFPLEEIERALAAAEREPKVLLEIAR